MRRTLILAVLLVLPACAGRNQLTPPDLPPVPEVITVQSPPKVLPVDKLIYVSIPPNLTVEIPHQELPTWQCIPERDQLRAKLEKANGDRQATGAIEGTSVKGAKP